MIRNLVISLALAMSATCMAQSDYQYRMEIGAGVAQWHTKVTLAEALPKTCSQWLLRCCDEYSTHIWR